MAFERAKIEIKAASVGTGVKVSLTKMRASVAKMKFSFSETVAKNLQWSPSDKIEVMIGNGEHHGILRMRKNNSAGDAEFIHRNALKGGYFQIALGHQPAFVDRAESARWCQFETVEDGWVEIILPKWADETGPARQKVAAAPVVHTSPQLMQPKRNVTASAMGDPPPGRREMLAKMGEMKA